MADPKALRDEAERLRYSSHLRPDAGGNIKKAKKLMKLAEKIERARRERD